MGIKAKKAARAVMMTGRARIDAALRIAWSGVSPSSTRRFCAKSTSSTVFETTMPTMKITPSSDWTLIAVSVR